MTPTAVTTSYRQTLFPADCLAVAICRELEGLDDALDVGRVVQAIRDIAEGVSERLGPAAALGDILFTLNDQLFNVLGFRSAGAEETAPSHVLLHRVLRRREADPLLLGIIYICVGRWLGLPLGGCDFPGHFMVRYHDELGGVIIDPVSGGVQLQEDDLHALFRHRFGPKAISGSARSMLRDIDDRSLVVRLLRRLKQAYLRLGQYLQALEVQSRLMRMLPDTPNGFRERGQLYELLGCPRAAAEDYSRYLDLLPDANDGVVLRRRLPLLLGEPVVLH